MTTRGEETQQEELNYIVEFFLYYFFNRCSAKNKFIYQNHMFIPHTLYAIPVTPSKTVAYSMVKKESLLTRFLPGLSTTTPPSSSSPNNKIKNNINVNNNNFTDELNHEEEVETPEQETDSLITDNSTPNNNKNNNNSNNNYFVYIVDDNHSITSLSEKSKDFYTGSIVVDPPINSIKSFLLSPTPPPPLKDDSTTSVDQSDSHRRQTNCNSIEIHPYTTTTDTTHDYNLNSNYFETMSVSNNTSIANNCRDNSSGSSIIRSITNNLLEIQRENTSLSSSQPPLDNSQTTYLLMHDKTEPQQEDTFFQRGKKILIAGTGFLCDAYDLFVINNVLVILKMLYQEEQNSAPVVATAALWGAVAGQLLFGFFADRVGRRIGFIITLSFITLGALGSTLSFNTARVNIFVMLAIWRTVLGFGVGGEYPLSATISSESASTDAKRGAQIASVFSMQGVGIIMSPIIVLILLRICGADHLDVVWRVALAFGGIPGLIMIYFRIRMKETKAFEKRKNTISKREIARYIAKYHWKTLLGTAGNWFIFDIVFYANGLFSSTIISVLGFDGPNSDYDKLFNTVLTALYLALLGLPGYFVGVALIDRVGRRNLQLIGFALLGLTYIIMGATFEYIKKIKALFIILYGLTFFFSNAGPNTTTYVLPSESFPTRVRATCHGISAACGKLGAVLGGYAIQPFFLSNGLGKTLLVCGGISFAGFILTFLCTKETMGRPPIEDDIELSESNDMATPGEPVDKLSTSQKHLVDSEKQEV
ncbi:major facilitator superfamily protein [Heterostelium album PN500]|uniref:Major facilitator superfamily protein n=1 Tax=Heterostelium pallidum (strain ATCC 26659 / Pp 5 / PN500) TaxID=670386 RepID=D3AX40_HETP5|nr:major facilitator superfamily protein [Heterostelium album PN500]EFA86109.1 major facilitator superfamily protein [Heterostelium album PN500]|eukprot:XP_020438214.1 major facilitator superfamily protein [Heterostelium album PN500]